MIYNDIKMGLTSCFIILKFVKNAVLIHSSQHKKLKLNLLFLSNLTVKGMEFLKLQQLNLSSQHFRSS